MSKVTEWADHDGLQSSDAGTGFRRWDFILDHGRQLRIHTDVCKSAGMESVPPGGFCFPHEVAGESEMGGVMLVRGIGRDGFNNAVRNGERDRVLTINTERMAAAWG